jgi:hypothetical protein
MAVGTFRLAFTWSCFFGSGSLCSATYSEIQGAYVLLTLRLWRPELDPDAS